MYAIGGGDGETSLVTQNFNYYTIGGGSGGGEYFSDITKASSLSNHMYNATGNIATPQSWSSLQGIDLKGYYNLSNCQLTPSNVNLDLGFGSMTLCTMSANNIYPYVNISNASLIQSNTFKGLDFLNINTPSLSNNYISGFCHVNGTCAQYNANQNVGGLINATVNNFIDNTCNIVSKIVLDGNVISGNRITSGSEVKIDAVSLSNNGFTYVTNIDITCHSLSNISISRCTNCKIYGALELKSNSLSGFNFIDLTVKDVSYNTLNNIMYLFHTGRNFYSNFVTNASSLSFIGWNGANTFAKVKSLYIQSIESSAPNVYSSVTNLFIDQSLLVYDTNLSYLYSSCATMPESNVYVRGINLIPYVRTLSQSIVDLSNSITSLTTGSGGSGNYWIDISNLNNDSYYMYNVTGDYASNMRFNMPKITLYGKANISSANFFGLYNYDFKLNNLNELGFSEGYNLDLCGNYETSLTFSSLRCVTNDCVYGSNNVYENIANLCLKGRHDGLTIGNCSNVTLEGIISNISLTGTIQNLYLYGFYSTDSSNNMMSIYTNTNINNFYLMQRYFSFTSGGSLLYYMIINTQAETVNHDTPWGSNLNAYSKYHLN